MIQGYMHFTKVSRAGSSGKGGGCEGRPRAALPLPSELLVTVLTLTIVRGLKFILCMQPAGAGELFAFTQVLGQSCLFHFFNGILQGHPGHCFFTPISSDPSGRTEKPLTDMLSEQPLDQIHSCTDFHTGVKLDFLGATLKLQQCN